MRTRKKILLWIAGAVGMVLALLAAAMVLALGYLNTPAIKDKIEAAISQKMGGSVTFERIDISVYPRPYVVFYQTHLSIPKTLRGKLGSLSIYPQLVPLMKGRLLISKIQVKEPDITVTLPETAAKVRPEALSLPEVKKNTRLVLAYLQSIGPGLVVELGKGKLILNRRGRLLLSLRDAAAHFNAPPGDMDVALEASTDQWGAFSLRGTYSFEEDKSKVKDLSVALGHSSVSGFSAELTWNSLPSLEVFSGKASLALGELYQWLSSAESLDSYFKDVTSLKGLVTISSMEGYGPLSEPQTWRMKIAGEAKDVVVDSSRLPAPLSMTGRFFIEENSLAVADLSASLGKSSISRVSARLAGRKNPSLNVSAGRAVIDLTEVFQWRTMYADLGHALKDIQTVRGTVRLSSMNFGGPLSQPAAWKIAIAGSIDQVVFDSSTLPGPVVAPRGTFNLSQDRLSFSDVQASVLDTTVTGSGVLSDIRKEIHSLDLVLDGTVGQKSIDWAFTTYALPSEFMVNPPLSLAQVHLTWQKTGALSFAGNVAVAGGPVISMDYYRNADERGIRRAEIKDRDTSATITLKDHKDSFDFSFSGSLALGTLNRIFANRFFGNGKLTGTLQAAIGKDDLLESTAKGTLEGNDIVVPWGLSAPLRIDGLSLRADTKILTLDSVVATLGESHFSASGTVTVLADGFVVDIDVSADKLNVSEIQQALRPEKREVELKKDEEHKTGQTAEQLVRGVVRFNSSSLIFGRYTFSPVKAVALVGPAGVSAAITEASVCGISVPGEFSLFHGDMRVKFKPQIKNQQLGFSISCLTGLDVHVSGTYNLNADINMQGKSGALVPSLEGNVDFKAKDGKIYRYPALAKILSVLSVTEILRGKIPELGGSGFPYHSMAVKGRLHQGKLVLEKAYIGGSSVDIIAQGDVDFAEKKMDLVVLVAPFSTINWIIRHIPLVGKIMGGTLISVPSKVSGDLANPDVTFLSPSAVGTRLLQLLENILELPVEIISPILPHKKEEQK